MVNNELDIDMKFTCDSEISSYYSAAAAGDRRLKHLSERIAALSSTLDRLWIPLKTEICQQQPDKPLSIYFLEQGKSLQDEKPTSIAESEEIQFREVRQNWLNQALEQVIFNYEPAEIGPDDDPRARKLRRDLVTNLGLVDFESLPTSREDLARNALVKCNYVFVVPDEDKASLLWVGIAKELFRSIWQLVHLSESVHLSSHEIFGLVLSKISTLYSQTYSIKGQSIFDFHGTTYPELKPINVFVAAPEYCWAPTVVASKSSGECHRAGFVMFRDADIGIAQMTEKSISIWCSSVLKIFFCDESGAPDSEICQTHVVPWSEEYIRTKRVDILSSPWT